MKSAWRGWVILHALQMAVMNDLRRQAGGVESSGSLESLNADNFQACGGSAAVPRVDKCSPKVHLLKAWLIGWCFW